MAQLTLGNRVGVFASKKFHIDNSRVTNTRTSTCGPRPLRPSVSGADNLACKADVRYTRCCVTDFAVKVSGHIVCSYY